MACKYENWHENTKIGMIGRRREWTATVPRLHDNSDAQRIQQLLQRHCDLLREALLNLKASAKHLCQSCNFAEPHDLAIFGDVSDMDLYHGSSSKSRSSWSDSDQDTRAKETSIRSQ